jgi:hypothetical protein
MIDRMRPESQVRTRLAGGGSRIRRTWPVSVPTGALALRGAEILVIPAGLNKRRLWGDLAGSLMGAQSRNLALVVSTHNMVEPAAAVSPFVAAPEELL